MIKRFLSNVLLNVVFFLFFLQGTGIFKEVVVKYFTLSQKEIPSELKNSSDADFHILLWHEAIQFWGGGEAHRFNLYKTLLEHKHNVTILVSNDCKLQEVLHNASLPYKTYDQTDIRSQGAMVRSLCKKHKKNILVCLTPDQLASAHSIADQTNTKVILEKHLQGAVDHHLLEYPDGIVGVSPQAINDLRKAIQETAALKTKEIVFIPPFINDVPFLSFSPKRSRDAFFKKVFNLTLAHPTVITVVARLSEEKNHALLIKSVEKIVYKNKKPVHVMLAGTGAEQKRIRTLINNYGLEQYVHVLGEVPLHLIPELLYHSDFHVLPSHSEAFGLVHLEASLMKKPILGASGTGGEVIIQDGKTGYVFKNNDVDDLAEKMMRLIDNKELQHAMGANAFEYARNNFSHEARYLSTIQFYKNIMKKS